MNTKLGNSPAQEPTPPSSGYLAWIQDRIARGYMKTTALNTAVNFLLRDPDHNPRLLGKLCPTYSATVAGKLSCFSASLANARAFTLEYHRHHSPSFGHRFSLGVRDLQRARGYAIVGRPVARALDHARIFEIIRVATIGARSACSKLYAAVRDKAIESHATPRYDVDGHPALFAKLITYTLPQESCASLMASGWIFAAPFADDTWNCQSRPRAAHHPTGHKIRWEIDLIDFADRKAKLSRGAYIDAVISGWHNHNEAMRSTHMIRSKND